MNFIIDEKRHLKLFISGLTSSITAGNDCVMAISGAGIALMQNIQNFEKVACLQKQCHIALFGEEMFSIAQTGVTLSCFLSNGQQDKQAHSKNIKLTEIYVDVELDTLLKSLRPLEHFIKKIQIQVGYRVTDSNVKKVVLQLGMNYFLSDGNNFLMSINVRETANAVHARRVFQTVQEFMGLAPAPQTQMQTNVADKLMILCFDSSIASELRCFNTDEGLDLQLDKEFVKVVPVLSQSDLTFTQQQFLDYKFGAICEQYGWIKHLLMDPNFIAPVEHVMRKHDLKGQLYVNRRRDNKKGIIYLCTSLQSLVFIMSTSTSVINLYDENATELDIEQLSQIVEQKVNSQPGQSDSNSKLLENLSNIRLVQDFGEDSKLVKMIHVGKSDPSAEFTKYMQFAEEQSKNYSRVMSNEDAKKLRDRLFRKDNN